MPKAITSLKSLVPVVALVALGASVVATAAAAATGFAPSVIALDQKPKGDSVSITYAYLPSAGTLAIFTEDSDGHMSKTPIGQVAVEAGDHRDVKISLSAMPKKGTELQAVLENAKGKPLNGRDATEESFRVQ